MTLAPQYHFRRKGEDILIWNVRHLVQLAEQSDVYEHPLDLITEYDEPYWYDATAGIPTSRSVMAHAAQVERADLSYPILLCPDARLIDGMHRVAKAHLLGQKTIKAKRLNTLPPPDFRNLPARRPPL